MSYNLSTVKKCLSVVVNYTDSATSIRHIDSLINYIELLISNYRIIAEPPLIQRHPRNNLPAENPLRNFVKSNLYCIYHAPIDLEQPMDSVRLLFQINAALLNQFDAVPKQSVYV